MHDNEQIDADDQQRQLVEEQVRAARAYDDALNEQRQAAQESPEALARAERARKAAERDVIARQGLHENTPQAQAARALAERNAHVAKLATKAGAEEQAAQAKAAVQAAVDEVIAAERAIDLRNDGSVQRVLRAHEQLARLKTIAKAAANRAAATK